MLGLRRASLGTCLAWALLFGMMGAAGAAEILGKRGAVATGHPLATDAALAAMKRGGNAVDAAVAAGLTLGVVDGHNSGIGGGCFFLIRTEKGEVAAIDGREMAPVRAHRDMFLRDGKAAADLSQTGALAAGTPGSLAAYDYALRRYGKLTLRDLLLPAAALAEEGFAVDAAYAARLRATAKELARFPEAAAIFLKPDGKLHERGEILKQADLARSYREIAARGIDWFYQGEFAERTAAWMAKNGGIMTVEDFRGYRLAFRQPVRSFYRGFEVIGFPPPSSGGAHVAQILNILERFDMAGFGAYSPDAIHVMAEAMKLAFADRAFWLGDPDFAKVPRGLVAPEYAGALAARIRMGSVIEAAGHGPADEFGEGDFGKHTTHFSSADAAGNWAACTATLNTSFGAKAVVPGTGILLNNQMDDFSAQPGVPNAFGLVGADANAVAPRKRPLSSMSPTLVLRDGKPMLSLGAAGGPTIISQTVVNLVNLLDYGMDPGTTLARPRLHQQWRPGELRIEALPEAARDELTRRGHSLKVVESMGAAQIIMRTELGFSGAHDPRLEGKAGGF